jgi:hypothetical protein
MWVIQVAIIEVVQVEIPDSVADVDRAAILKACHELGVSPGDVECEVFDKTHIGG